MPGLFGRRQRQMVSVAEAREILEQQEAEKLIDQRAVAREARERVEQGGLIFLDEIDKVAVREGAAHSDVSREGVQRDLLPIVEGTTVTTKYGMVKTDHILFIAAGAFHMAKPSDLIPELQGRLPIRVELDALGKDEFVRILTEPEASLTKQYQALLDTERSASTSPPTPSSEVATLAVEVNSSTENIGARRLATLMERLLEEVSFEAPETLRNHHPDRRRLRAERTRRHRQRRGPEPLCALTVSSARPPPPPFDARVLDAPAAGRDGVAVAGGLRQEGSAHAADSGHPDPDQRPRAAPAGLADDARHGLSHDTPSRARPSAASTPWSCGC